MHIYIYVCIQQNGARTRGTREKGRGLKLPNSRSKHLTTTRTKQSSDNHILTQRNNTYVLGFKDVGPHPMQAVVAGVFVIDTFLLRNALDVSEVVYVYVYLCCQVAMTTSTTTTFPLYTVGLQGLVVCLRVSGLNIIC